MYGEGGGKWRTVEFDMDIEQYRLIIVDRFLVALFIL